MAPKDEDLYDALVEDVQNLRQLGKTWGLDDAEIDSCFERAVKGEENGARKPAQPRKKRGRACRCFGVSVFCFVALLATGYCLVNLHKPTELFMMRQAQKFMYPIMRSIRHYSMPLRDAFDLSGLHEMECILSNPFYGIFAQVDCWPCENVKTVRVFSNLTNYTRYYYHSGIPLVVKDSNLSTVTFDDLKSVYLDNKDLLHYSANNIQSSNHFITSIGELFNPTRTVEDVLETDLHVQWKVLKPGGVRLIRDVSPKPYFVPKKAEVATEMFVLIHAPAAEAHSLPMPVHPNAWLTQGYGSQEVTLTPVTPCKYNCTEVSVVLQPSDVLYYAPRYWQVNTFSIGDEISIAFLGSFF
ncbi:uncharacterized protein [Asterias amurensis]|uniref:uncharacterized protein n=1 Tax=Asterias amurensis TaxID=7602 RepID=UPI003AB6454B